MIFALHAAAVNDEHDFSRYFSILEIVFITNILHLQISFIVHITSSLLLCRNCAFPQTFHTRRLDQITVFFAVNAASFSSAFLGVFRNFQKILSAEQLRTTASKLFNIFFLKLFSNSFFLG